MARLHPTATDTVVFHESAWTAEGKLKFDTTRLGASDSVVVNSQCAGLIEAFQQMVVGEKRRLWMPKALYTDWAPETEMLVFDLELLALEPTLPEALRLRPPDSPLFPPG